MHNLRKYINNLGYRFLFFFKTTFHVIFEELQWLEGSRVADWALGLSILHSEVPNVKMF